MPLFINGIVLNYHAQIELAALDRKTTAELAPKYDENDGTKNKQEQSQPSQPEVKTVSVKTTDPP